MHFQVARLQDINRKIQFNCKLNFKNAIDVLILLEIEQFDLVNLNTLIGAGVKVLGIKNLALIEDLRSVALPVKLHFLGELQELSQENLELVLANCAVLETVSTLEQAEKISHANALKGRVSEVLMRINVLNEEQKYGFLPAEMIDNFLAISNLSGIRVIGLNSYVPAFAKEARLKKALRKLKVLFVMLQQRYKGIEVLSLNLQDNLADLIAEGVTEVRMREREG